MVNSGKKKYTKKTIMRGGAIEFSLIPFTQNNRQNISRAINKQGSEILQFIDGTQDTFFNTFRRVKFSKSCSKCYLVNQGGVHIPYQLIYKEDNNVYQYTANNIARFRLVKQNSQMSDEDVARLLNVTLEMLNPQTYPNPNNNPAYKQWESLLYNAISNGQISIEQIYNFLYTDGNSHKAFKAGKYVSNFWTKFHSKYESVFF
jgi:hypothetical protein